MSFYIFLALSLSSLFSNSARLASIHQLNARASVESSDIVNQSIRSDGDPPLEGCQANFFSTTCCCFVDAGILKQDTCQCKADKSSCERQIRPSFHDKPSRAFPGMGSPASKWWKADLGYIKGYQAVGSDFCAAAAVERPQVDSRERELECTCSTSMGANFEMVCGGACDVKSCKRWNPDKVDWNPFDHGRGKCCLSSFNSASKGCEQEVKPLTESAAKTVLVDAVKHSALGERTSFVLSSDLVQDMTKSFETAKQKKMSTSRSGAEFFFSGDYRYILKSIHRPEYDALYQISQPREDRNKKSLIEYVEWNRQQAVVLKEVENCMYVYIKVDASASPLAAQLDNAGWIFKDSWSFEPEISARLGTRTYFNHIKTNMAVWCAAAGKYRILTASNSGSIDKCADLQNDVLHSWLVDAAGGDNEEVARVYANFVEVFEVAPSKVWEHAVGPFSCYCEAQWWPRSLINDFVIAFEYKSSTWMVVKNSVMAVRQELERHQFTNFHKEYEMFDVKPFPIHSDERALLFGTHFSKAKLRNWENWLSVRNNLENDVKFMKTALDDPLVDYSLLVSVFYINDERRVLAHTDLPNCIAERIDLISTVKPYLEKDYGHTTGSILVCFSVIDMLMEFTFSKTPENLLLFLKWSDWDLRILNMFDCLGNYGRKQCDSYNKLRPDFRGVDIPSMMSASNPVAFVQDVTDLMNGDGELIALDADQNQEFGKHSTYKCCCHSEKGICTLVDIDGKSGWSNPVKMLSNPVKLLFGNRKGCQNLVGDGWHSYWRYAGYCRLPKAEAEQVRKQAILLDDTATQWST